MLFHHVLERIQCTIAFIEHLHPHNALDLGSGLCLQHHAIAGFTVDHILDGGVNIRHGPLLDPRADIVLRRKLEHLGRNAATANERAGHVHLAHEQLDRVERHERLGRGQQHRCAAVGDQREELVPVHVLADTGDQKDVDRVEGCLELFRVLGTTFKEVGCRMVDEKRSDLCLDMRTKKRRQRLVGKIHLLDKLGGAKLEGLVTLVVAGRDGNDFLAFHRSGPLNGQMAQTTNANNTNGLVGPSSVVFQRRVGGQTSAEQRSS